MSTVEKGPDFTDELKKAIATYRRLFCAVASASQETKNEFEAAESLVYKEYEGYTGTREQWQAHWRATVELHDKWLRAAPVAEPPTEEQSV